MESKFMYVYTPLSVQNLICCHISGFSIGKFNAITTRVPAIRTVPTYLRSAYAAVAILVFKVAVL
jgi:hypothetical protein